jgi:hypothetical protein
MEDWRYENLREDLKRLREELCEVRGRTHKVESWQSFFPLRAILVVSWLIAIGMVVFAIAGAAANSQ